MCSCNSVDDARPTGHRLADRPQRRRTQRGLTLVELIAVIVVVGVVGALAAGAVGRLNLASADPMIQRQSLAIAESLLAEVLQQATPDNDPDGGAEALGPEAGEARGSVTAPFDHVNDYNGFSMSGIRTIDGTAIAGLASYSASVVVRAQALDNVGAADGWWVEVTVTGPDGRALRLSGWRARLSG